MNLLIRIVIVVILLGLILITVQSHSDDARYEVLRNDYEALKEAYDELYKEHEVMTDGYRELQQEHSRKTEQIEYLEYRIMSDDEISEEFKQEIKENVPGEGKQ